MKPETMEKLKEIAETEAMPISVLARKMIRSQITILEQIKEVEEEIYLE